MKTKNKKTITGFLTASAISAAIITGSVAQACSNQTTSVPETGIVTNQIIVINALNELSNATGVPQDSNAAVFYNTIQDQISQLANRTLTITQITIANLNSSVAVSANANTAFIETGRVQIMATDASNTFVFDNNQGSLEFDNINIQSESIRSIGSIEGLTEENRNLLPSYASFSNPTALFGTRSTQTSESTEPFQYTSNVEYPIYNNLNNFGESQVISSPSVGGYVGIDRSDSTQYRWLDAAKYSEVDELIIGFNTQNFNTATNARGNVSTMQNEGESVGNAYYNQIQAIHALGKSVTLGFGGYLNPGLENVWNTAPSAAALARLIEDAVLAYGVHTLDFDIESDNTTTETFTRLAVALGAVRNDLRTRFNYEINIRFTVLRDSSSILSQERDQILLNNGIDDYTVNFMFNSLTRAQSIINGTNSSAASLFAYPSFSGLSTNQVNQRVGATFGSAQTPLPINELQTLSAHAVANQWGFLGVWQLIDDHPRNSVLERQSKYQWPTDEYDFQTSQTAVSEFQVLQSFNGNTGQLPVSFSAENYYTTQQEIAFRWDPVENADSYEVYFNDGSNDIKVLNTTTNTAIISPYNVANARGQRTGSIWEFADSGTYLPTGTSTLNFTFFVRAINSANNNSTGTPLNSANYIVTIDDTIIEQPLYSYNDGVPYGTPDVGRYLYYNTEDSADNMGSVWEIISPTGPFNPPSSENTSYSNISQTVNLTTMGYSSQAISDLFGGLIVNYVDTADLTVSYPASTLTNFESLPSINNFLYDRL